jgi:hypothetical protein
MQNVRALPIARYGVSSELHGPCGYGYFCAALVATAIREVTLMLFLDLGLQFLKCSPLSLHWFCHESLNSRSRGPLIEKNTDEVIFLAGAFDLGFLWLGCPVVFLCLQNDGMSHHPWRSVAEIHHSWVKCSCNCPTDVDMCVSVDIRPTGNTLCNIQDPVQLLVWCRHSYSLPLTERKWSVSLSSHTALHLVQCFLD